MLHVPLPSCSLQSTTQSAPVTAILCKGAEIFSSWVPLSISAGLSAQQAAGCRAVRWQWGQVESPITQQAADIGSLQCSAGTPVVVRAQAHFTAQEGGLKL